MKEPTARNDDRDDKTTVRRSRNRRRSSSSTSFLSGRKRRNQYYYRLWKPFISLTFDDEDRDAELSHKLYSSFNSLVLVIVV